MKYLVTTTMLAFLLICGKANAQFIRSYGLSFGRVNSNQSWLYTSGTGLDFHNRWGYTVGVFLEAVDLPFISLVGEARYLQNGFRLSVPYTTESNPDGTSGYAEYDPREDYISTAVLLRVRYLTSVVTPYIIAGPRLDVIIFRDQQGFNAVIDEFHSTNFGATLGAGVDFHVFSPLGIFAEFRYNPDFTDSFNNGFLAVKNGSVSYLIGMRL